MPRTRKPRAGSMQFWPRKQTKRVCARVRSWVDGKETRLLGFAGYKVGMTHLLITDNRKTSLTKGEDIFCPVTVIECPPLKASSIRFYKKTKNGLNLCSEIFAENLDKELERRVTLPKKTKKKVKDVSETQGVSEHDQKSKNSKEFDDIRLMVHTQPKLTSIGKKKPELFEVAIGGNKDDKLKYAKEKLGKEINIKDVLKEGQQIDIHSITKAKGLQGPVKRFGIGLKRHKSEKGRRAPGTLGGWKAQGHFMYRVAHAGRMGYNLRTEYNKWLLKIGDKADEINIKGGFLHYGLIKNQYILIKGSVGGSVKRMIRLSFALRPNKNIPAEAPSVTYTSLESKQ